MILIVASLLSCSEDAVHQIEDPSELLYTDTNCGVRDLFWLNSETVLFTDNCGNLKRINVTTNSVQRVANFIDYNHLHQASFFTSQIPNSFFYLTLSNNDGVYEEPHQLYRLNLSTKTVQLVADNLHNPSLGGYVMGNKHLVVQKTGDDTILVINLETLTSEEIDLNGFIAAFSPDDEQAIVYLEETETVRIYDFNCDCLQPTEILGSGTAIWRETGIFGVSVIQVSGSETFPNNVIFEDLITGEAFGSLTNVILGAYVAPQGTLTASFVASPQYDEDFKASLVTFDLFTHETQTLVTVHYNWLFTGPIEKVAISPDQKKVSYVFNYFELRMVKLE